jgi:hypothetical protein
MNNVRTPSEEIRTSVPYKAAKHLLIQKKLAQKQINELNEWLDLLNNTVPGAVTLAMKDIQSSDKT